VPPLPATVTEPVVPLHVIFVLLINIIAKGACANAINNGEDVPIVAAVMLFPPGVPPIAE